MVSLGEFHRPAVLESPLEWSSYLCLTGVSVLDGIAVERGSGREEMTSGSVRGGSRSQPGERHMFMFLSEVSPAGCRIST